MHSGQHPRPGTASDKFTALLVYCASRVSVEGGRAGPAVPTHRPLSPPPADPGQNQIQTHYQYRISPLFRSHLEILLLPTDPRLTQLVVF